MQSLSPFRFPILRKFNQKNSLILYMMIKTPYLRDKSNQKSFWTVWTQYDKNTGVDLHQKTNLIKKIYKMIKIKGIMG
jgi:hypothetical protein